MRAVQFSEYGDPAVLQLAEVPEPHAGPGRIRIAVRAASVNSIDWKYRSGMMKVKSLPFIPGTDVAGVVDEIGDGITDVAIGDEVFGSASAAGSAEFVLLKNYARKPAAMSWFEAAAIPMAAETAVRAMDVVGVQDGTTLVINGASGGVGSAAVQLAVARGATVIGLAGAANHAYLTGLGAVPVTYGDGFVDRVRAAAPQGVDAAFDVAGSGVIPELIELTGDPSRVVSIADFGAGQYGAKVTGGAEGRSWQALAIAADLFTQGRYHVEVQQVFPLAEAPAAHRISQAGHVRGKLVIDVTA